MAAVLRASLLSSKVWYFWSYAAAAFIIPFLNLYFQRLGFSKEEIGLLTALRPWLSAISGNVFAIVADYLAAHKTVLLATYTATALLRFSLSWVQSFGLMLALVVLMEVAGSPINIIVDAAVMGAGGEREYGKARLWGAVGWGCLAPVAGAVVLRFGIRATFYCNIALATLGFVPTALLPIGALRKQRSADAAARQPDVLGKPQLPGSCIDVHADAAAPQGAYAECQAAPALACLAVPAGSGDGETGDADGSPSGTRGEPHGVVPSSPSSPMPVWEIAAHVPLISAPELQVYDSHTPTWPAPLERANVELREDAVLPGDEEQTARIVPAEEGSGEPRFAFTDEEQGLSHLEDPLLAEDPAQASKLSLAQKTAVVLSSPEAVAFFCIAALMGYGMGTIDSFLFLFLDELGGSELLMGLTITITCVAEVPVFFFTGWLLEAVGVNIVLHGVLAVYILRLSYYSILQYMVTPWAVLPIELLHGVTFGLAWAAGTINCSRISPPGLETTMQAIFQGLFSGVGLGLGGLVGGVIYHRHGAPTVFASAAAVLAAGWCLCGLVQALVVFCHRSRRSK